LRPQFEIFESPKSRKHRLNEELKRYTEEQLIALDAMNDNERVVFTAPAGTGKTLLALEAARRASAAGRRVLFLCFNRFLGQVFKSQAETLPGVRAGTLHSYMISLTGLSPENGNVSFWEEQLPAAASERLLEMSDGELFDELIVDEIQDVLRENYLDFLDLSLKGGLAAGRWRMFGDFEKQKIYGGSHLPLEMFLKTRGGYAPIYSLRINCRNTPRIAATARWLGQMNPNYSRILRPDNGVEATLVYYQDPGDQQRLLIASLNALYDDGFSGSDIVVLSPKLKGVCTAITRPPWSDRLTPFRLDLDGHVGYCSIHAFKGLEAPAVIVTDIEQVAGEEASQLFYVAVTRSLHRLTIITNESARAEVTATLQRALIGGKS
jgi:superfamily I DNA/RNA helicase